jgi:hypothetical protein
MLLDRTGRELNYIYLWNSQELRKMTKIPVKCAGRSWSTCRPTFPNSRPQDIAVVDVHHYPLAIERIFINRTNAGVERWEAAQKMATNMYPRGSLLVIYLPLVTWCTELANGRNRGPWPLVD